MDTEGREINYIALYMDLTAMCYLQSNPLHLLRDYAQYETLGRMNLPRYRDACREVQEAVRITAQYNLTGAEGLIDVATRLQERDTLASRTALFWLENALSARAVINSRPRFPGRPERTVKEVAATRTALNAIIGLRERDAA